MEPKPFYPAELTERSRRALDVVCAAAPGVIVIGGWATWVRTGGPMSHDIDLIATHEQLAAITAIGTDTSESSHVGGRKWRTLVDGVHVDLYVPYQSRLGQTLQLRVEDLARHTDTVDPWRLLSLPAHLGSKFAALTDRPHTNPGVKDRYEIAALILGDADAAETITVLAESSQLTRAVLAAAMERGVEHLTDGTLPPEIQGDLRRRLGSWRAAVQALIPSRRNLEDERRNHPRRR